MFLNIVEVLKEITSKDETEKRQLCYCTKKQTLKLFLFNSYFYIKFTIRTSICFDFKNIIFPQKHLKIFDLFVKNNSLG